MRLALLFKQQVVIGHLLCIDSFLRGGDPRVNDRARPADERPVKAQKT